MTALASVLFVLWRVHGKTLFYKIKQTEDVDLANKKEEIP
jgi:hypothetical protein